jgi:hypothetical protein
LIALPLDDEAVGRQALIRAHDGNVADDHLLDRDFAGLPVAAHGRGFGASFASASIAFLARPIA